MTPEQLKEAVNLSNKIAILTSQLNALNFGNENLSKGECIQITLKFANFDSVNTVVFDEVNTPFMQEAFLAAFFCLRKELQDNLDLHTHKFEQM